jgi:ATP-dependent RNA helicase DDX55/SPB4
MDKATRAFVSNIQSNVKHEYSVLFRVKGTLFTVCHDLINFQYVLLILLSRVIPDLDFGRLAAGFGLLTLPKMPELEN